MKRLVFCISIWAFGISLSDAQTTVSPAAQSVRLHTEVANEATHGMLIIHRLLELYNQELNKHVDLDNYQLNNISNLDFPEPIFKDQSGAFYAVSPYTLLERANKVEEQLPKGEKSNFSAYKATTKNIIDELEQQRRAIPDLIARTDLSTMDGLKKVYKELENCVKLYDRFQVMQYELNRTLRKLSPSPTLTDKDKRIGALYAAFAEWHDEVLTFMLHLRKDKTAAADAMLPTIKSKANQFIRETLPAQNLPLMAAQKDILLNVTKQVKNFSIEIDAFHDKADIPETHRLYGKNYYYYNSRLINLTNRFGVGAIQGMNEVLVSIGSERAPFVELPHYYKVIYPQRKKIETAALEKPAIVIPTKDEHRDIVVHKEKFIKVKSDTLFLEVFDHQVVDNDTISLNFNGDWILRKQPLTGKPYELQLPLVSGTDNYLILHAENLGVTPPNTCALRYFVSQGKREPKRVILNSDFNVSEMILIKRE